MTSIIHQKIYSLVIAIIVFIMSFLTIVIFSQTTQVDLHGVSIS